MSTATVEIYRTESGSVYEVEGEMIRRTTTSGPPAAWQRYRSINRIPASLFAPGETGEVLEVLMDDGRRIFTSRLVLPFG